jgi:hypothetical protein
VGDRRSRERRWRIATVRGEGGCDFEIWAYGRTLEEARRRAAAGDPRAYITRAGSQRRSPPTSREV